jgi:hypothetical protein
MSFLLEKPEEFLEVLVDQLDPPPGLLGMCAGYECGQWRSKAFAEHLMEWLPDFALNWSENQTLRSHNAVARLRRAARLVYSSENFSRRGEFGELLLHAVLRQVFDTLPAISKIYYKDSSNDTVKGFDAVHVVATKTILELWLGEVKFHDNASRAISHVLTELKQHLNRNYLRMEFIAISNKVDSSWPHAEKLRQCLHRNTSLDKVFERVCIPVLLTYDSQVVKRYTDVGDGYKKAFTEEVTTLHKTFVSKLKLAIAPAKLRIHLILVPLASKKEFVVHLDKELRKLQ